MRSFKDTPYTCMQEYLWTIVIVQRNVHVWRCVAHLETIATAAPNIIIIISIAITVDVDVAVVIVWP